MSVLRIYHSGVVGGWRARERGLLRHGVDVTLVSPRRWNEGGSTVSLTSDDEPWVVPARTLGRHPYGFLYNPFPIARALLRQRFDVIDVHEEPASLAAFEVRMLCWLRHRRTPMVFYGAQNLAKTFPIPFRWIERGSLRRAAAIYPCNREAGEILRRKGFKGLVQQLPLGVDCERFSPRPDGGVPQRTQIRVGYVGRLEEHKGVQIAIDAVSLLPEQFSLDVHGDGPHRPAIEEQIARLGLQSRVRLHGHAAHDALPQIFRQFDMLLIPSQTRPNWVEQFGRVAVESMASGCPIIASDSGSLPDVVGDAGLVVPEADVRAWADAIESIGTHSDRRLEFGRRAVDRARQFTWDEIAVRQIDFYRSVIG